MKASVIIPTYNRAELLALSLESLCNQTTPETDYEVIVSDDGSQDHTGEIIDRYNNRINLKYIFQPDKGYRVAQARNNGIKAAGGEIFIFMDSGTVCSSHFIKAYLDEHIAENGRNSVFIGYVYAFDHSLELKDLPSFTDFNHPDRTISLFEETGECPDVREQVYGSVGDDLSKLISPWVYFWTSNVSVRKTDIEKAGGFCEDFTSWGVEDLECGYRLYQQGLKFKLSRKASVIHYPHERHRDANIKTNVSNKMILFKLHPAIETELLTVTTIAAFNTEYAHFLESRKNNIVLYSKIFSEKDFEKIGNIMRAYEPAVLGCQDGLLLKYCKSGTATEHNPDFCNKIKANYPHVTLKTQLGVKTFFEDNSFPAVLAAGAAQNLTEFYFEHLIIEAKRIGRVVFLITSNLKALRVGYEKMTDLTNSFALVKIL